MNNADIIAQNLIFNIPKKRVTPEGWKEWPGVVPATVIPDSVTTSRKNTARSKAANMNGVGVDEIEQIVIPNENFTITLREWVSGYSKNFSYCGTYGCSYPTIAVNIDSPELQKVMGDKKIALSMLVRDFFEILTSDECGYISERKLHGTFCVGETTGSYSYAVPQFVLEDPLDKELRKAKSRGKIITTGKGTSKWIPGHKYYVKSKGIEVLALGTFDGVIGAGVYSSAHDHFLERDIFGNNDYEFDRNECLGNVKVYLKLDRKDISDAVNAKQGTDLPTFFLDIVKTVLSSRYWYDPLIFRKDYATNYLTGIDQGEFLDFDSSLGTVSEQVKRLVESQLNGVTSLSTDYQKAIISLWPEGIAKNKHWFGLLGKRVEDSVVREITRLKNNSFTNITAKNLIGRQTVTNNSNCRYSWNSYVDCDAYRWYQSKYLFGMSQADVEKKLEEIIKKRGNG